MKVTDRDRHEKIIKSYLVLLMVLIFAFCSVLGIDRLKSKIMRENPEGKKLGTFITILTTILILAINTGLAMLVKRLTIS